MTPHTRSRLEDKTHAGDFYHSDVCRTPGGNILSAPGVWHNARCGADRGDASKRPVATGHRGPETTRPFLARLPHPGTYAPRAGHLQNGASHHRGVRTFS